MVESLSSTLHIMAKTCFTGYQKNQKTFHLGAKVIYIFLTNMLCFKIIFSKNLWRFLAKPYKILQNLAITCKTSILPNCQVPNGFIGMTVNCLSQFFLVTGFFERTKENISHIFWALISSDKINVQIISVYIPCK